MGLASTWSPIGILWIVIEEANPLLAKPNVQHKNQRTDGHVTCSLHYALILEPSTESYTAKYI